MATTGVHWPPGASQLPGFPRLSAPSHLPARPLRRREAACESAPRTAAQPEVRTDIQALRAGAALSVVAYHYWPAVVPGGYIGVDVFFVISGFLITALLLREIERTGKLAVAAFWARRARRILPAALLVLLVSAVAIALFVPLGRWDQYFGEIRASTLYVENWHLAGDATDYFAADADPSPVRHYWSLSAEEQFYLVWPLMLVAALAVSHRALRLRRWMIAVAMATLVVCSLAYSIAATAADPASAFYITPTRAWEFGAGGLLALAPRHASRDSALWSAVAWLGLSAIALGCLAYTTDTSFPGPAALLPVTGAVLVIAAATPTRRWSPTRAMSLRPIQFCGDISYSLYLWHWPVLILAPFVVGGHIDEATRGVLLMLAILAAWLSKVLVEDPVRFRSFLVHRRARWTFAFAAMATLLIVGISNAQLTSLQREVAKDRVAARAVLAAKPDCFGAASHDPDQPCVNPRLASMVVPSPAAARGRPNAPCTFVDMNPLIPVCAFGAKGRPKTATVALMGDSHAGHWRAALEGSVKKRSLHGLSLVKAGCPFTTAVPLLHRPLKDWCRVRNHRLPGWFARHPSIDTLFVTARAGGRWEVPRGKSSFETQVDGYIAAWSALPATIKRIIVIRDNPWDHRDTADCVERAMTAHRPAGTACAVKREDALVRDAMASAALRLNSPRIRVIDLTRYFCSASACSPVIGGALVHKDAHHLTVVFARTLAPYFEKEFERVLAESA